MARLEADEMGASVAPGKSHHSRVRVFGANVLSNSVKTNSCRWASELPVLLLLLIISKKGPPPCLLQNPQLRLVGQSDLSIPVPQELHSQERSSSPRTDSATSTSTLAE